MDRWKFYDIIHRDHTFMNPMSAAKFDEMVALLNLRPGQRVLDIACGKGEFLLHLARRDRIGGIGVDLSPYCIDAARKNVARRAPDADLTFIEADGAEYAAEPASFAMAICLGASWVFGGHRGTLRALARFVPSGGQVLVGEPIWLQEPAAAYLEASGLQADDFSTHAGNVAIGVEEELTPLYSIVSNHDDWDRYEGLHWRAAETYATEHPGDPDVPELLERVRGDRETYLRWGRDTLGWAIYLFRKP